MLQFITNQILIVFEVFSKQRLKVIVALKAISLALLLRIHLLRVYFTKLLR